MICSFIGNRTCSDNIEPILTDTLINLIENKEVDTFYIGDKGEFEFIVINVLKKLRASYPKIKYYIALAYLPVKANTGRNNSETIYFEGLEKTPAKYAISKRNILMINKSDFIITYIRNKIGYAARFDEYAKRKGKTILPL